MVSISHPWNETRKEPEMEYPVERWYDAVKERGSRRKYAASRVEESLLERIRTAAEELREEIGSARAAVKESHDGSVFSGLRGGYGVIRGAPSYAAFIAHTSGLLRKTGLSR
jgi:hypothetical protein